MPAQRDCACLLVAGRSGRGSGCKMRFSKPSTRPLQSQNRTLTEQTRSNWPKSKTSKSTRGTSRTS